MGGVGHGSSSNRLLLRSCYDGCSSTGRGCGSHDSRLESRTSSVGAVYEDTNAERDSTAAEEEEHSN